MKQAHLLLVEDNEGDIYLTMEAMQKSTMIDKISVLKNGLEVLTEIKESKEFKKIPVIMLTTSSAASDIAACYNRHVNCFITKPSDADSFLNVVTMTENFWIQVVTLPNS